MVELIEIFEDWYIQREERKKRLEKVIALDALKKKNKQRPALWTEQKFHNLRRAKQDCR